MKDEVFETILGALVIIIAAGFLFFAYTQTDGTTRGGYDVTAKFNRIDGIMPGSDVRMSGIKVGTVAAQELDAKTYMAVLHLTIRSDVQLPEDSSVKISTEGVLGGSYVNIEPGGSFDNVGSGGELTYTQGSVDLMSLLGQAIFALGEESDNEN
jgi:phospholipid/cholesterol/gamma-HCH transport system substrate-binding protein